MKILFIHPEGNVNNNPNLLAILELCHQEGCSVDVLSESWDFVYQYERDYFKLHLVKDLTCLIRHRNSGVYKRVFLNKLFMKIGTSYDLIIGVDREGLLIGSSISQLSGTPLGFISYEILFAAEIGEDKKQAERDASSDVCFAVCQDTVRAEKLAFENDLPLEKILCIPVAGRDTFQPFVRSTWLRDRYAIPPDKKIALYMGSIESWAGFDLIVEDLENWPDDWVLVLHGRYKMKGQFEKLSNLSEDIKQKVFISDQPFERLEDLAVLPLSADIGLALYSPDWTDPLTGDNLKYLGWSSGKACTYMQCGLPVLTNEDGVIAEASKVGDFGYSLPPTKRISDLLRTISRDDLEKKGRNARNFFFEHLDFSTHAHKLIKVIQTFSAAQIHRESAKWSVITRDINAFYLLSFGPVYELIRKVKKLCLRLVNKK